MLPRATCKKYFGPLGKPKRDQLSYIYFVLVTVTPAALGPQRAELHAGLPECPMEQNAVAPFLISLWQRDPPVLRLCSGDLPSTAHL